MKRLKLASIAAMIIFSLMLPFTALAETGEIQTEQKQSFPVPTSVERKNIDGKEYLIKIYETAAETKPDTLTEPDFELDGFIFTHETTDGIANEKKETKEITEEAKAESQNKNLEEIIKQFPSTKPYEKDGYKGTLSLDTGSIVTEVAGYTTKNYTVSTVKEYPGLMYADPSYVSQTAIKDGYTLPLTDISWTVMGTGLAGDSLVPTEYKATATYAKTFSSQVPTGYVSTARYRGMAERTEPGTVTYTVTYMGTPIAVEDSNMPTILKIVTIIIVVLMSVCAVVLIVIYLKNRKGADVYNLIGKEYICIGHQAVDKNEPTIDLNEFEDMIQSYVFQFVLDKKTTNEMFGRNISVTLKDVTVKHRINERNSEYKFDLDLGGVLDAE